MDGPAHQASRVPSTDQAGGLVASPRRRMSSGCSPARRTSSSALSSAAPVTTAKSPRGEAQKRQPVAGPGAPRARDGRSRTRSRQPSRSAKTILPARAPGGGRSRPESPATAGGSGLGCAAGRAPRRASSSATPPTAATTTTATALATRRDLMPDCRGRISSGPERSAPTSRGRIHPAPTDGELAGRGPAPTCRRRRRERT